MPSTTRRDGRNGRDGFRGRSIVVVTPVALNSDSRTRKQVMSLVRWGARVTVYAGGQLITGEDAVARSASQSVPPQDPRESRPRWIAAPWAWVRRTNTPAVFLLPVFALWLLYFYWRTFFVAYGKIPRDADLYVLHEFGHFPVVARAARDRPIVYDAHDFYTAIEPVDQVGSFDRNLLIPFSKWLESRCVARANEVLTVSPGLAQLYQDAYGKAPVVVRNCHDARLDETGVVDLRTRLGLLPEDIVIGIAGNWKAGQKFDSLLRVLASGPSNLHLVLIGGGYQRLHPAVAVLELGNRVHELGRLMPSEIVPALAGADAAAILYYARTENYRRALPNGFFQSVAAGLPILYPDLPEIRALAEQGDFGLMVDWSDEMAIASALSEVSEHTQKYKRVRRNAQKAARTLSWENEEVVFANVLSECLRETAQAST